jgi:hypothetical protein
MPVVWQAGHVTHVEELSGYRCVNVEEVFSVFRVHGRARDDE